MQKRKKIYIKAWFAARAALQDFSMLTCKISPSNHVRKPFKGLPIYFSN
jgi:hypothetical protein